MSNETTNNEQRKHELSEDFFLNEVKSMNDAANGLVQAIILVMGAYIVFAWALIERLASHEAEVAQRMAIPVIAHATNVTSMQNVTFFTGSFIFYSIFVYCILVFPLALWAWAVYSARVSKKTFKPSGNLHKIYEEKLGNYNQGLKFLVLGFIVAVSFMSILAGIISDKF